MTITRTREEAQPDPPCKTGSQCIGGKCPQCVVRETPKYFAMAIEAKLKEKNHG